MEVRIIPSEAAPLPLLLAAGPCLDRVRQYLRRGVVFIVEEERSAVAVAVSEVQGSTAELHNIEVLEERRGHGLGRTLLLHVLVYAASEGVQRVEVGSGNSSLSQLSFYQRRGFRITGVWPGFFDTYQPPIIENGIWCRDMIRLAIDPREANKSVTQRRGAHASRRG